MVSETSVQDQLSMSKSVKKSLIAIEVGVEQSTRMQKVE